jgi:hypothetical protein
VIRLLIVRANWFRRGGLPVLTSGNSGLLAVGWASLYSLALGAAAVLLALLLLMSPEPFNLPSRSNPGWAGARPAKRSRIRRRLDAMLFQMLSDDSHRPRRADRGRHKSSKPAHRRRRRRVRGAG